MMRALIRFLPGLLPALLPILAVLMLSACGSDEITHVTLAELVANPTAYDGRTVAVRGRVHSFDDPRHYWLEDEHINRVGLLPSARIAPHLQRHVQVTGRFSFSRDRGRRITVEQVELAR